MRTISQRQLRNDNAEIVREVEAGESFTVTRRGVPVARLVPLADQSEPRCDRPAKVRPRFADLDRVRIDISTSELLDELRGER